MTEKKETKCTHPPHPNPLPQGEREIKRWDCRGCLSWSVRIRQCYSGPVGGSQARI